MIDLTHCIDDNISVFPGDPLPKLSQINIIARDGYNQKQLTFATHTGTHIDAPAHVIEKGKTLDLFNLDKFFGKAFVIDVRNNRSINLNLIEAYSSLIIKADFVLFHTGQDEFWGKERYFIDYPYITEEAARKLVEFRLKGVGLDCISPDKIDANDLPIHKILLSKEVLIIENLTNLSSLAYGELYNFFAIPLSIKDADGSPIRAFAKI